MAGYSINTTTIAVEDEARQKKATTVTAPVNHTLTLNLYGILMDM